jgi:hypothetical protein
MERMRTGYEVISICRPKVGVEWAAHLLRVWVPISGRRQAILTEAFRSIPRFLETNVGEVPQTRPHSLPSTSFPIQHSLIT